MDATVLRCVRGSARQRLHSHACISRACAGPHPAAHPACYCSCWSQKHESTSLGTTASMCGAWRPPPTNWWLTNRSRRQVRSGAQRQRDSNYVGKQCSKSSRPSTGLLRGLLPLPNAQSCVVCPFICRRLPQRPLWPAVRAAGAARPSGQPPAQPRRSGSSGSQAAAAVAERRQSGGGRPPAGAALRLTGRHSLGTVHFVIHKQCSDIIIRRLYHFQKAQVVHKFGAGSSCAAAGQRCRRSAWQAAPNPIGAVLITGRIRVPARHICSAIRHPPTALVLSTGRRLATFSPAAAGPPRPASMAHQSPGLHQELAQVRQRIQSGKQKLASLERELQDLAKRTASVRSELDADEQREAQLLSALTGGRRLAAGGGAARSL